MAHTNSTNNYGLPQWIGSDKPTFLGDFNSAFNTIDTQMKSNADTAAGAAETASSANATAISANETAVAADNKATLAKNTADAATNAAQSASDLATIAKNTADGAARTAQANNIANLAPAYDETRTYAVGDLVTYVDENNSGKLYRCIVAWNTPGAFNINYWDDVTATEVFTENYTMIGSWTPSNTTTWRDFLYNTLYQALVAALPQSSEQWVNFDRSDIVLGLCNSQTTKLVELFRLNRYADHIKENVENSYTFDRIGSRFPEASTSSPHQEIWVIMCSSIENNNVYEDVRFDHEVVTNPGDNTAVTVAATLTLQSNTFTLFNGDTEVRLYQRK